MRVLLGFSIEEVGAAAARHAFGGLVTHRFAVAVVVDGATEVVVRLREQGPADVESWPGGSVVLTDQTGDFFSGWFALTAEDENVTIDGDWYEVSFPLPDSGVIGLLLENDHRMEPPLPMLIDWVEAR